MSEQLRFIVQNLNKPPFNKNFNVIHFDSFNNLQLLQVLNDVFTEIDAKHKFDTDEEPVQTALQIMSFLQLLKYKPEIDTASFQQGLIHGEKSVIYPILEWLLTKLPELKKRAYLAKFLVRIDVPQEFLSDMEVSEIYQQYHSLMEEFKETHKQYERIRGNSVSTAEIRRDITNMEEEKEQLLKRIERIKRKVDSFPSNEVMLASVKSLHQEQEKEIMFIAQNKEQSAAVQRAEQKIQRLIQQKKELQQSQIGATPEGLLKRIEEEIKVNTYIAKEKLPREFKSQIQHLQDFEKIVLQPTPTTVEIEAMYNKIQSLTREINDSVGKSMSSAPADEKLALFRQQAALIARKKSSTAESLKELQEELAKVGEQLQAKHEQTKQLGNNEILKGDNFKQYVSALRGKSVGYKKKKQELSEMKAEIGVLCRTEEVLKQKQDKLSQNLSFLEAEKGVEGFIETQEGMEKISAMKSEFDIQKANTLAEISEMVNSLNSKIAVKKASLAPIIKELRPLRQKSQDITTEHDIKKAAYDSCAAGQEANQSKLQQEVKVIDDEFKTNGSRYFLLNCEAQILQVQLERATSEIKYYLSADPAERKKSLREHYIQHIQEQEKLGKSLREEQKLLRDSQQTNKNQMKMWQDLKRLMECKRRCAAQDNENRHQIVQRA